jgi:hypothetical protein
MDLYFDAPIWDDDDEDHRCPHTSPKARTVDPITVKNMVVIDAPHATYRSAHFGGTFIVAKPDAVPEATEGWYEVEVYCLWFKHRLKTRGLMFKVDMSKARVRKAKSCDVVFNIAK